MLGQFFFQILTFHRFRKTDKYINQQETYCLQIIHKSFQLKSNDFFVKNWISRQPSSETLRETPLHLNLNCFKTSLKNNLWERHAIEECSFDFDLFYKKYGQENPTNVVPDQSFLEWFIGFFEGEGSWQTRINNEIKPKRRELSIVISQKEKKILTLIQKTFGFGQVNSFKTKHSRYWRWLVYKKNHIECLALIFKKNLILHKRQNQYKDWIRSGQSIGMFQWFSFENHFKTHVALNNAWLSGFLDAEGCFYAKTRQTKRDFLIIGIEQKWILNQKDTTQLDKVIFEQILLLFQSKNKVYSFRRTTRSCFIEISVGSIASQKLMINYLNKYPLKTIKKNAFFKWFQLYLFRTTGVLTFVNEKLSRQQKIQKIKKYVKSINQHCQQDYD
jgi:hypothetical protein